MIIFEFCLFKSKYFIFSPSNTLAVFLSSLLKHKIISALCYSPQLCSSDSSPQSLSPSQRQRSGMHWWLSQRKSPVGSQVNSSENRQHHSTHHMYTICNNKTCVSLSLKCTGKCTVALFCSRVYKETADRCDQLDIL